MKKARSNIMIGLWVSMLIVGGCLSSEDGIDGTDGTDGIKVGFSVGNGSEANPYEIQNIDQLKSLIGKREYLAKSYKLMKDLDLSGVKNFKPIGSLKFPFVGNFDGNGKVIKNLTIDRATEKYVGLFGNFDIDNSVNKNASGVIKNIGLENVNVKGKNFVGGLVGRNFRGTLQNIYVTGKVEGNKKVGGLVGENLAGKVETSYVTAKVVGKNSVVGGLVGSNNMGTIEKSYMAGDVKGFRNVGGLVGSNNATIQNSYTTGNIEGNDFVGGLVGANIHEYAKIKKTYATGNVEGKRDDAGGLVGSNRGTVEESYATGNVIGKDSVGGLVGNNLGTVANSYATGKAEGKDKVGGLVGNNDEGPSNGENGSINNSYARGDKISGTNEVGGLVGNNANNSKIEGKNYWKSSSANEGVGEEVGQKVAVGVVQGKTDERLRALSALETGWSPAIWDFKAGQYPKLNWQN